MAYVERRERKKGVRYRGPYKAADGRYRSAGTFSTGERALAVAEEAERHAEVAGGAAGGLDPAIRATRWPNGTFAEALFAVPPFGAVPPAAALGRIEKVVLRSTQVEDGPDRNHLRVIFPGAA